MTQQLRTWEMGNASIQKPVQESRSVATIIAGKCKQPGEPSGKEWINTDPYGENLAGNKKELSTYLCWKLEEL